MLSAKSRSRYLIQIKRSLLGFALLSLGTEGHVCDVSLFISIVCVRHGLEKEYIGNNWAKVCTPVGAYDKVITLTRGRAVYQTHVIWEACSGTVRGWNTWYLFEFSERYVMLLMLVVALTVGRIRVNTAGLHERFSSMKQRQFEYLKDGSACCNLIHNMRNAYLHRNCMKARTLRFISSGIPSYAHDRA